MLSRAAPFIFTHLDAMHSNELVCTDASDDYLGAVSAGCDPHLHGELWRLRNRKGWSSHLVGTAAEYIIARAGERDADDLQGAIVSAWDEERSKSRRAEPQRSLIETWDYLEVCCGRRAVMITACSKKGLRCGPMIDILLHPMWDVRSTRVVEWLIFLVHRRRVFHMHFGAPCTTFSIARMPKSRTREQPLGKDPIDPPVRDGNLMLLRTMLVLFVIYLTGIDITERWTCGSHEHPSSAYSWHVPSVDRLFQHPGCTKLTISYCDFNAPYRKNTTLGLVYAGHFEQFRGRTCKGGHEHIQLKGSLCGLASEYPPGLCNELADAISYARRVADETILDDYYPTTNTTAAGAGAFERLYFNEILESADWHVLLREACGTRNGKREHINLLEVRACFKTIARRASTAFKTKQLYGLDSQVGLGALAKGRSPSLPLNEELRTGLPHVVGHQHYPGYLFAPTRLNPADCPTRSKEIPPPRGVPRFLVDAAAGNVAEFDLWAGLPLQTRSSSNWARFMWRLLRPQELVAWPW